MTLTVQSVRSVGFGMLIEQISFGANFMLIGPQENVSLRFLFQFSENQFHLVLYLIVNFCTNQKISFQRTFHEH